MKRISTHILDLVHGKPATMFPCDWRNRTAPETGGCWPLRSPIRKADVLSCCRKSEDSSAGVYRLIFDTGNYFARQKIDALYPVVEVTFQVREGESHFHIPLLLSPNGYTTYRGS